MSNYLTRMFMLAFILSLISCYNPREYFTHGIRRKVQKQSIPLNKLQFYIDRNVELRRTITSEDAEIVKKGKVVFEDGKYVHIIQLKKFTPGLCSMDSDYRVRVAFEEGSDRDLVFGVFDFGTPDDNEKYILQALEWDDGIGRIEYEGETYFIQKGGDKAKLMIKKDDIEKYQVEKRKMKGIKVE